METLSSYCCILERQSNKKTTNTLEFYEIVLNILYINTGKNFHLTYVRYTVLIPSKENYLKQSPNLFGGSRSRTTPGK